ncbi:MAG: helix-turn-helix transcriptional regulator [bacterium]|nr:helix-turn-helix transcriptional regulator [bacterium]
MRKVVTPELGQRIKTLRKALKMQQKEFAAKLEIAPSYLSEIESGKIKPGYDFFVKVTGQYDVNPFYLLHGEEPVLLEHRPKEKTWPKPGEYGRMYPEVFKLLWYMKHSTMLQFGMLEYFSRYLASNEEMIHKQLQAEGEEYPGTEED